MTMNIKMLSSYILAILALKTKATGLARNEKSNISCNYKNKIKNVFWWIAEENNKNEYWTIHILLHRIIYVLNLK